MTVLTLVERVERELAEFYGFSPETSACHHLVTKAELHASLGDPAKEQPEWHARAGVWLTDKNDHEEVFIGLHLGEDIRERLVAYNPFARLNDDNLDAFCVLVEEVSHFHLIVNRARANRTVSRLELEWQGEIDKLVMAARALFRQSGDEHLLPLARKLFDGSHIEPFAASELYWQATKYAARFWFEALRAGLESTDQVRPALQSAYEATWVEKLDRLFAPTAWKRSA